MNQKDQNVVAVEQTRDASIFSGDYFSEVASGHFFAFSALILLFKPLMMLSGMQFFSFPPGWDLMALALVIIGKFVIRPAYDYFAGMLFWVFACVVIDLTFPSISYSSLLVLMFCMELFAPNYSSENWCVFWLGIPAFSGILFGEPLCPILQVFLVFICFFLALETTLPNNKKSSRNTLFVESLTGLLAGAILVFLSPVASSSTNYPEIIFDEYHKSSESALPERNSSCSHEKFFNWLKRNNYKASLRDKPFGTDISTSSLYISILPQQPLDPGESSQIVEFVNRGGKLIFITDHTDMDGASSRFAPILASFGVTTGFSTVSWPGVTSPFTRISSMLGGSKPFPGTGADIIMPRFWLPSAISASGPRPLIWLDGTTNAIPGAADAPLNMQYAAEGTSPNSSQPLFAGVWGNYGKGKWAYLADSSYFQDSQFPQNIQFAQALLSLLSSNSEPFRIHLVLLLVLIIVIVAGFHFFYRNHGNPFFFFALIASLAATNYYESNTRGKTPDVKKNVSYQKAVLYSTGTAKSGVSADRPANFMDNCDELLSLVYDSGFETSVNRSIMKISTRPDLLITAPGTTYIPKLELKKIDEMVKSGSSLILFAEPESDEFCEMIASFGFSVSRDPEEYYLWQKSQFGLHEKAEIPPYKCFSVSAPSFTGWETPLWTDFPVPIYGGKPLLKRSDEKAIAAMTDYGNGKVFLFGDKTFFQNRALEIKGKLEDKTKKQYALWLMKRICGGQK
ncbi:MAG: hypothetical protein HQM10_24025 [Candidatus Riflebacteria bacterium]|nr:hypothetical protein [Candidatus Riflebacteria bacterium]